MLLASILLAAVACTPNLTFQPENVITWDWVDRADHYLLYYQEADQSPDAFALVVATTTNVTYLGIDEDGNPYEHSIHPGPAFTGPYVSTIPATQVELRGIAPMRHLDHQAGFKLRFWVQAQNQYGVSLRSNMIERCWPPTYVPAEQRMGPPDHNSRTHGRR